MRNIFKIIWRYVLEELKIKVGISANSILINFLMMEDKKHTFTAEEYF